MISSISDIDKFISDKSFKKIFILTGKNSFEISGAKKMLNNFFLNKKTKIFYKNSEIPVLEELTDIVNDIKSFKPDLILAIGGGAVIDYSKIANVIFDTNNISNLIINYSYPIKKKNTKLAVIPTTAGAGAEVTSNAVLYINKIKYSLESDLLIPDFFFLIPEFLISAPNKIKASAGFDCIAQALESLVSKKSNDLSVDYALKSLEISIYNYTSFLEKPNFKNAAAMSLAANLAGKAINISKTTAPHAVSYPFTSLYKISHGHAVSLFFESFFKFNFYNIDKSNVSFDLRKRFDLIFNIFQISSIEEFSLKISSIKNRANLESDLSKLDINVKKNFDKVISGINLLRLSNNPVKLDEKDIYKIITKVY